MALAAMVETHLVMDPLVVPTAMAMAEMVAHPIQDCLVMTPLTVPPVEALPVMTWVVAHLDKIPPMTLTTTAVVHLLAITVMAPQAHQPATQKLATLIVTTVLTTSS